MLRCSIWRLCFCGPATCSCFCSLFRFLLCESLFRTRHWETCDHLRDFPMGIGSCGWHRCRRLTCHVRSSWHRRQPSSCHVRSHCWRLSVSRWCLLFAKMSGWMRQSHAARWWHTSRGHRHATRCWHACPGLGCSRYRRGLLLKTSSMWSGLESWHAT